MSVRRELTVMQTYKVYQILIESQYFSITTKHSFDLDEVRDFKFANKKERLSGILKENNSIQNFLRAY